MGKTKKIKIFFEKDQVTGDTGADKQIGRLGYYQ